MNLEKINDFIDAYSKALQIDNEYTAILKELIPKLVEKYSEISTNIPVEQDNENKYIIKPVDGKYLIEDFFLNRLMRNVLSLNIGNIGNREKGGFIDSKQTIDLDIELIDKQLQGVISEKNPQYQEFSKIAKKKVIMHEFEHALQTQYKPEAFVYVFGETNYKKIFAEVSRMKNGKYKNLIVGEDEFNRNLSECDSSIMFDVKHNGLLDKDIDHTFYENVNEIFNETEALEMAEAKVQDKKVYPDGTYFVRKNNESSNRNITNYGYLIKVLLDEKNTFKGMYFNPKKMFTTFNKRYGEIFEEIYGKDSDAWNILVQQINDIKKTNSQEMHLKLQSVLARCLEKKTEHDMQEGISTEELKKNFMIFKNNSLWNDEKDKRDKMEHIQILKAIREKIKGRDSHSLEFQQEIGKSQAQVEREQKDNEAEQRTEQQTKEFKESTSDKANQTFSKKSIRTSYVESVIDRNEIQSGQQILKDEIDERREMKKLQFIGKNRTPEQERRLQELEHIYQTNQQQIRRQSKDNGMNR